jgi:hypothetical protein
MAQMVTNMNQFTENQTRLVVVVDGLDSCEQDKVLQILDNNGQRCFTQCINIGKQRYYKDTTKHRKHY